MEHNMNFQVNLSGLIDLLSNHLYSNPGVFIRELLQNGVDAVTARKKLGHQFDAHVRVETYSNYTISIQDNGIGLTANEIMQFLAKIGSTTKKDNLDDGDDYIGQFGVGLLSCFIVSDEIVLITRSALEGDSLEWRGKPDGTYQIKKLENEVAIGSTVYLKAKPEFQELFQYYELKQLLRKYGRYLDTSITLLDDDYEESINEELQPWRMTAEQARAHIYEETGNEPVDIIPLQSSLGGIEGFAAILPYAVSLQEKKRHHMYLKNILMSDEMSEILPDWAFFVDGIMNTTSLKPTASRESFQQNDLFYVVQDELGAAIKQYFKELAQRDISMFERILSIHYASIKALAIEEEELYSLFIPYLKFETTFGELSTEHIVHHDTTIYVTASVDEFRQIARVAKSQNMMVINGGYVHDLGLIRQIDQVWPHINVKIMDVMQFSNRFTPLSVEEQREVQAFLALSDELLKNYQCDSIIRYFEPADLPVLYNTNKDLNFFKLMEQSMDVADPVFVDIINVVKHEFYDEPTAKLCYNYNNAMVRKVISSANENLQRAAIELFYTQALLMGNHSMSNDELKLMNESLFYFMNMGLAQVGEEFK